MVCGCVGCDPYDDLHAVGVQVMDTSQVLDSLDVLKATDFGWPRQDWRRRGGKAGWGFWSPRLGMEGTVVHRWTPNHCNAMCQTPVEGRTVLLVELCDRFVPIFESGVQRLEFDQQQHILSSL